MDLDIAELHHHTEYMSEAADLLNDEWPRSKTARLHSLEKSCDTLPCSLVLLTESKGKKIVIGHSLLSAVYGMEDACFVESVVIQKNLRGKGYGRELMIKTEDWAKKHGYSTMYLTTMDKQGFYSHLGYATTTPVLSVGSNSHRLTEDLAKLFLGTSLKNTSESSTCRGLAPGGHSSVARDNIGHDKHSRPSDQGDAPSVRGDNSLPLSPSAPSPSPLPAPPPPPPPPRPSNSTKGETNEKNDRTVKRMDPNATTWMKKSL